MTTVHHTPITTGAAANAATINAPLSEIDTKLGAAKTSGHIIYADASGNLAGGATLYRHPITGNIIIGDASPTDIIGATLNVAGSVVVSDGAGATLAKIASDGMISSIQQTATIASGVITATTSYMLVNTEANAASDDLVRINGYDNGGILFVSPGTTGQTIVIKNNAPMPGGIYCIGSADVSLTSRAHVALLVYAPNIARWIMVAVKNT